MKAPSCPKCGKTMTRTGDTPKGKARWQCVTGKVYCYSTTNPKPTIPVDQKGEATDKAQKNPQFKRKLGGVKRYIITAAQNATPVHAGFFASLQSYAKATGAELVVIPIRYKNPTSVWSQSQSNDESWAPETVPYLYNQRKKLNSNLVLLGDVKTIATAASPLTGFEAITHRESGILGHTKMQLKTIPTQSRYPKILATTGAVTLPNYTDSKTGALGAFHHVQGALVAEIQGSKFHLRQVNAEKDGTFIDLVTEYRPTGKPRKAAPASALIMGDTHHRFMDPSVEKATFLNKDSIVKTLQPERLVFHDLIDMYSRNPHDRDNVFIEIGKRKTNLHDVASELKDAISWLDERAKQTKEVIVVPSNHDNMLFRWIRDNDWRDDPDNASFYLETALAMVNNIETTSNGSKTIDPFVYWLRRLRDHHAGCVITPGVDEGYSVHGIELGLHGDKGPNGARGSINNLKRIGVKSVIGHTHSPGIAEGCYQTGTSSLLKLGYTSGPSSWMHTHCVIYANGKRSLVSIVDGKWKL